MNGNVSLPGEITTDSAGSGVRDMRSLLLIASLITLALQFIPYSNYLIYPIRLFVTFIHESGHALASVLSGGNVFYLQVHTNGEGVTWSHPGNGFMWLMISGGYLGTALFGAILLQTARLRRPNAGRVTLYAMSAYLAAITILWAHNPIDNLFTLVTGLLLSAGLWLLARFATPRAADFVAAFLAVQCSINALSDLRILLTITHNNLGDSDAKFMTDAYGLFPTFWAVCWALIAVAILSVSLYSYLRATGMIPALRRRPRTALSG